MKDKGADHRVQPVENVVQLRAIKQKYGYLWSRVQVDSKWQRKELDVRAWCIQRRRGKPYVVGADWTNGRRVTRYLHRVIMNAPPGVEVDHINGDTLDNRRCNLRLCTRAENARNQKPQMGCSSSFKGVRWHKRCRKWQAQIKCYGRWFYLGLFDDEEGTAFAYDVAARILFGEFARLNFQDSTT